jgi:hypothetical protein
MVPLELKFNRYSRTVIESFFGFAPVVFLGQSIYRLLTYQSIKMSIDTFVLIALSLLIALILHFSYFPHFKIIITAMGIERHYLIKVGPFIFEKHYLFPWNTIHSFEYLGAFLFCYLATSTLNGKEYFTALINFALTNKRKA